MKPSSTPAFVVTLLYPDKIRAWIPWTLPSLQPNAVASDPWMCIVSGPAFIPIFTNAFDMKPSSLPAFVVTLLYPDKMRAWIPWTLPSLQPNAVASDPWMCIVSGPAFIPIFTNMSVPLPCAVPSEFAECFLVFHRKPASMMNFP
jgi:hypothetical protein